MKPEPALDLFGGPCAIPPLHETVRDLEESEFQFAKLSGELLATLRLEKNREAMATEGGLRNLWNLVDEHFLPRFAKLLEDQRERGGASR